jgi:hypothetical protein
MHFYTEERNPLAMPKHYPEYRTARIFDPSANAGAGDNIQLLSNPADQNGIMWAGFGADRIWSTGCIFNCNSITGDQRALITQFAGVGQRPFLWNIQTTGTVDVYYSNALVCRSSAISLNKWYAAMVGNYSGLAAGSVVLRIYDLESRRLVDSVVNTSAVTGDGLNADIVIGGRDQGGDPFSGAIAHAWAIGNKVVTETEFIKWTQHPLREWDNWKYGSRSGFYYPLLGLNPEPNLTGDGVPDMSLMETTDTVSVPISYSTSYEDVQVIRTEKQKTIPIQLNSRLRMPELLIPGRKPVGSVEIDHNNPLSKNLHHCFTFTENNGLTLKDLVSKVSLPPTDSTTITSIEIDPKYGKYGYISGEDDLNFNGWGGNDETQTWFPIGEEPDVSFFIIARYDGTTDQSDQKTLFSTEDGTGTVDSDNISVGTAVEDGNWHSFAGIWSSTGPAQAKEFWLDGNSMGTGTLSVAAHDAISCRYAPSSNNIEFRTFFSGAGSDGLTIGCSKQNDNDDWNGGIAYCLFFKDRLLSDAEIKSLHADPFQVLKPIHDDFSIPVEEAKLGGFILPEPRYEMPELLIPGRKPTGPVVIDWESSLTEGLLGCYLYDGNPNDDMLNHVTGEYDAKYVAGTSTNTIYPAYHGGYGKSYYQDLTDQGSAEWGPHYEVTENWIQIAKQITLISLVFLKTAQPGSWPYIISLSDNTSANYAIGFKDDPTRHAWVRINGVRTYYTVAVDTVPDKHYTLAGTYGDGFRRAYLNGDVKSAAATGNISTTGTLGLGTNPNSPGGRTFNGYIYYSYIFDRCLSQGEIKRIHEDPYQFLIPE